MSKFYVIWTDEDGAEQREAYNSYYLATVRKGKLKAAGRSADITEKIQLGAWCDNTSARHTKTEKEMIRKLKRETSNKIREGNKKVHADDYEGGYISRGRLSAVRRARAFRMVNKGQLR